MSILRIRATLFAAAVLFGVAMASLGGGVPAAVHYISHDKVAEVMSKGGPIVSDPGLLVLAQRRGAGEVESHDRTNHVFIFVDGEATLVVGGTMVDPRGPRSIKCVLPQPKAGRLII